MFNLGYKEIVLNSLGDITDDGSGNLSIPGYGVFNSTNSQDISALKAIPAAGEVSTFAVPAGIVPPVDAWGNARLLAIGDVFECQATFRSMRNVSSHARDFIMDGKTLVWMSTPIATADEAGIAMAIDEGITLAVAGGGFGHEFEQVFDLADNGADLEFTIKPGFEYIEMKKVAIKYATAGGAKPIDLKKVVVSAGEAGLGLGKWLEESRRMGTAENVMPYAQSHGGNDQGIDVRGMYATYMFEFQGENLGNGWASHEYVDHSYVNAEMSSKPVHYVIYANEGSADLAAALAIVFGTPV
ncbi:MAG: hypothetical protein KAH32_05195 [Chlamydiia bacterium]|nr:hypothetical protein [Chlamydiia bacterium]